MIGYPHPSQVSRLFALAILAGLIGLVPACAPAEAAGFRSADSSTVPTSVPVATSDRAHGDTVVAPARSVRPARYVALLVGVGDYSHMGTDENEQGVTDLRGPRNDVPRLRKSLEAWGFRNSDDVRVLLDADATQADIAEGFRWVASRATEPGDVVVLYFSGHGSNAPDLDGDEADPNRGGVAGDDRDEGLVPFDADDIHDPSQLVLDDSIHVWLQAMGTDNVTLIVDACYSGTVSRGANPERPQGRARGPEMGGSGAASVEGFSGDGSHALLTAASSTERAWELPLDGDGRVFGVMTYHLTRILDGASRSDSPATTRYSELLAALKKEMRGETSYSTPELRGRADARVFNIGRDVLRPASARVQPLGAGRYALDVGAVHGVRLNEVYDVYRPADEHLSEGVVARLVVREVESSQSVALPLEGSGEMEAGAHAVPAVVPVGAERLDSLRVYVDSQLDGLEHPLLQLFEDAGTPIALVGDTSTADSWLLPSGAGVGVFVNGVPLPHPDTTVHEFTAADSALCAPLRRALAISQFDLVDNAQSFPIYDVDFRVVPAGERPGDRPAVGEDTVRIGERYDFYVRVSAPGPLFVSVAFEGYAEDPWVAYTTGSAAPVIPADGEWHLLPRGADRHFAGIRAGPPAGFERVKIFAGEVPYDFSNLIAGLPRCDLLYVAGRGGGEEVRVKELSSRWITTTRSLRFME